MEGTTQAVIVVTIACLTLLLLVALCLRGTAPSERAEILRALGDLLRRALRK
jgi:hypothetical protein